MIDSNTLCYDREVPNGRGLIMQRAIQGLPSKPKTYFVNIFMLKKYEKEEKAQYLKEKVGMPEDKYDATKWVV